jgi:hypothetical protein
MLGDVADYGNQDHSDEKLGDPELLDQRLYSPTNASET